MQQAIECQQRGDFAQAEQLYRAILGSAPNHVLALNNLGVIAHQFGHHQSAAELIGRSLAIRPSAEAFTALGSVMRALNKLPEAQDAFARAATLAPHDPAVHTNLASVLWVRKELEQAKSALQRALAINPDFTPALHNAMVVLGDLGEVDEAVAHGSRAAQL